MRTFIISRNLLLGALLRCQHAISNKAAVPAYLDYWFSFSGNRLLVSASDGEVFMQESLALDANEDTAGVSFGLYRYYLINAIKSLDEQPLTFNLMDYQVEVVHSRGRFYLRRDDATAMLEHEIIRNDFDFYVTKGDISVVNRIHLEIPGIKHWIDLCFNSLADDYLRPAMNCICLDFMGDNYLQVAASDGHQLTVIKKLQDGADFNAKLLLPRKVCKIIQKCLPKTGVMELNFTEYKYEKDDIKKEEHIQDSVGTFTAYLDEDDIDHTLYVRFRDPAMDSRYPKYQSVIPQNFNYYLELDRIDLLKSINRLIPFTNDSGMLTFYMTPEQLTISAQDKDYEMGASEELPCEFTSGQNLRMGFKGRNMASLLKRMNTERVYMNIVDSSCACIMQPKPQPDVEDLTFLMMPMLCND